MAAADQDPMRRRELFRRVVRITLYPKRDRKTERPLPEIEIAPRGVIDQYSDHECNYGAVCQNGGRLLTDRAPSRLLGQDWPRTLAGLEERGGSAGG